MTHTTAHEMADSVPWTDSLLNPTEAAFDAPGSLRSIVWAWLLGFTVAVGAGMIHGIDGYCSTELYTESFKTSILHGSRWTPCTASIVGTVIPCFAFVLAMGLWKMNPDEERAAVDRWVRNNGASDRHMMNGFALCAAVNGYYRLTWYWGFNVLSWRTLSHFQFLSDVPQVRRKLIWVLVAPVWLMLLDILKTMAIGNLPWRSGIVSPNLPTVGWGYGLSVFMHYNLVVATSVIAAERCAASLADDEDTAASKAPLLPPPDAV